MIARRLTPVILVLAVCGLTVAPSSGQAPAKPSVFAAQVKANFARWDLDGDGELTKAEIDRAIADPKNTGPTAATIAALGRAARGRSYKLPPLTVKNLLAIVPKPKGSVGLPDFDALVTSSLSRIEKAKRHMYIGGGPRLTSIKQGRLGDCFALAPLGAMLHRDRASVERMFAVHADGSVTVTFAGERAVRVKPPTDAELALMASTSQGGIWVNFYEKAVGEYRAKTQALYERSPAVSAVASGGSAGAVVELLTGNKVRRFSCKPWRDKETSAKKKEELLTELRGLIAKSVKDRRLVCGGSMIGAKVPGILGQHAYAVLGFDGEKDEVTLWNPHGNTFTPKGPAGMKHGYQTKNGQFRAPLTELVEFFGGFAFETDQQLARKAG